MNLIKLILSVSISLFLQDLYTFEFEKNIPKSNPLQAESLNFYYPKSKTENLRTDLMLTLKNLFKVKAFIESGTHLAGTTLEASKVFDRVYTIELSKEYYNISKAKLLSNPNTRIYLGDSGKILYQILPKISGPMLFYLDGHWSEQNTARGDSITPIMNEIHAIKTVVKPNAVILVDDVRLFQSSLYPEKIRGTCKDGYPSLKELMQAILEIDNGYQFCFLSDALLAFPPSLSISVSPLVRACSLQRLSAFYPNIDNELVRESANIISNAKNDELDELIAYYQIHALSSGYSEFKDGYFCYAALWYGLTLMNTSQEEGVSMIRHVFENCLPTYKPELLLGDFYGKVFPEKMELSSL